MITPEAIVNSSTRGTQFKALNIGNRILSSKLWISRGATKRAGETWSTECGQKYRFAYSGNRGLLHYSAQRLHGSLLPAPVRDVATAAE
jgi:hypothetical protein